MVSGGTGRFPRSYIQEGGSWGKHGFPHGSEPKASDAHAAAPFGLRITSEAFVPPKAKALSIAARTFRSRATFGT